MWNLLVIIFTNKQLPMTSASEGSIILSYVLEIDVSSCDCKVHSNGQEISIDCLLCFQGDGGSFPFCLLDYSLSCPPPSLLSLIQGVMCVLVVLFRRQRSTGLSTTSCGTTSPFSSPSWTTRERSMLAYWRSGASAMKQRYVCCSVW